MIAGAFHDVGVWSDGTLDYLLPSARRAREYLKKEKLETWAPEIELMVTEHHKLRASQVPGSPLVELFRKADLIDVSLGFFSFGLAKAYIKQVRATFPTAGFYQTGARLVATWVR